jgi:hypothetical protein
MKHKLFLLTITTAIMLASWLGATTANAENISPTETLCNSVGIDEQYCPDNNTSKLEPKVNEIITIAFQAVGAAAVIFLIYGGIMFAMSGGDAEKVKKAKSIILYALIGLSLAILANFITDIVTSIPTSLG